MNDAVTIAPHLHTIIFENEKVRVLKVTVPPGSHADLHSHPDNVVVVLEGGSFTSTNNVGEAKEVNLTAGTTFFSPASEHIVDNNGTQTVKVVQVELKQ